MGTHTRTRRTKRTSRAYLRGLACARCELIFRKTMEMKQYDVALAAIKLQCHLHGFKIDDLGPLAPILSPDAWRQLHIDSGKRRDS